MTPPLARRSFARTRLGKVAVVGGIAGMLLFAAACGGSTDPVASGPAELGSAGSVAGSSTTAPKDAGTTTTEESPGTTEPARTTTTGGRTDVVIPELTGDFCVDLRAFGQLTDDDGDVGAGDLPALRTYIDDLKAEGPSELEASFDQFLTTMEIALSIDADDPNGLEKSFEAILDPAFIAAVDALNAHGRDTCGFVEDVVRDLGGDDGDDGDTDDGPSFMEQVDAFYGSSEVWTRKQGHSVSSSGTDGSIAVTGDWVTTDALQVCGGLETVAKTNFDTFTIEVLGSDGTVLARLDDSTGNACAAA